MKSIGTRITFWYAATTTVVLACLFVAGHYLLNSYLIHQLNKIAETQFSHIKNKLGPEYAKLTPQAMEERLREFTETTSALFYFDMYSTMDNRSFRSSNLRGHSIADIKGDPHFSVDVEGIGLLKVNDFKLPPFDVMVATPLAPVKDLMAAYRKVCFGLLAVILVVSTLAGYALSVLILRPVRIIQATANRIGLDNLNERIPVSEVKDEISQLAILLNKMFDRLETSFDETRRFTADASHELKTPLSLVRLHAERLLMNGGLNAAQKEAVQVQLEELARVNQIIDELLFLSRADAQAITVELMEHQPEVFLEGFKQDARVLAEHQGVKFLCEHHGSGTVAIDGNRIRQVLLNLLVNALNVSPPGGVINLESLLSEGVWYLSMVDDGPGLTLEQCERIFERFVRLNTTGKSSQGSGLGLAISRSIIKLHKGRIWATSDDPGRGLRISMKIPAGSTPEKI